MAARDRPREQESAHAASDRDQRARRFARVSARARSRDAAGLLVEENGGLVQLFGEADTLAMDAYFVYPEELKSVARIQVFRDFLVANAQRWHF